MVAPPNLVQPVQTHWEHALFDFFYFPIVLCMVPPQDSGVTQGRSLSVAYSFLFLLIEGVVGFHSCDHSRQWPLVTEEVNCHFSP